jgi:hypothetical protein
MNRRTFALTLAKAVSAASLAPAGLQAALPASGPAAGWSSARAARLLVGARFGIEGRNNGELELIAIEPYRGDDRQFFASFRSTAGALAEGHYRLSGPAGPVELYLQTRGTRNRLLEAVICHARTH